MKEVVQNACHRLQCKLQYDGDVPKKTKLDSEFPERRLELAN
jgi:hypothetical protein